MLCVCVKEENLELNLDPPLLKLVELWFAFSSAKDYYSSTLSLSLNIRPVFKGQNWLKKDLEKKIPSYFFLHFGILDFKNALASSCYSSTRSVFKYTNIFLIHSFCLWFYKKYTKTESIFEFQFEILQIELSDSDGFFLIFHLFFFPIVVLCYCWMKNQLARFFSLLDSLTSLERERHEVWCPMKNGPRTFFHRMSHSYWDTLQASLNALKLARSHSGIFSKYDSLSLKKMNFVENIF